MELSIQKLSKAFNQKIVFSNIDLEIHAGSRLAITGSNGSGKSTLLKILSGGALPSSGQILYHHQGKGIKEDQVYKWVHFVAPYNTVIEELTLPELFQFHQDLGTLQHFSNYKDWVSRLQYPFHPDHRIKTFSSGMKQRLKLGLVLLDDRPLILLDEPGSNLDSQGKDWFYSLLDKLSEEQTLIIATNDSREKEYCRLVLNIEEYSKR
jgi:ABC-type multidrug transport system ATPase subunit